ncbi:MAG: choice-of-anchor V domain-containing protein, partial [Acidobacteriota bacterium]
MKKKSTWIALTLVWGFTYFLWANASGPEPVALDASGTGCFKSGCHLATGSSLDTNSSSTRMTVTGFPATYSPGTVYDVTIQLSQALIYGFQAVTVFANDSQAGALAKHPQASGIATQTRLGVTYINHDNAPSTTGTFRIQWTAPNSTQDVRLIVFGNCANGNGDRTGDVIVKKIFTASGQQAVTLDKKMYFAQFGEGPGLDSLASITNPSATQLAQGRISFFDTITASSTAPFRGNPMTLATTAGTASTFDFTIQPRGVFNLRAINNGDAAFSIGWVLVESNIDLGGTGLFVANFGVAGVGQSNLGTGFITPVQYNPSLGISTGVALIHPGAGTANVTIRLKDAEGVLKATSTGLQSPS